jgi:uncharacterized membrane protein
MSHPLEDEHGTAGALALPVRTIDVECPWQWLAKGWRDLWRAPSVSLGYGAALAAASGAVTIGLWLENALYLMLPMLAGFMMIGPLVATGLYETSRRLERGESASLRDAAGAFRAHLGGLAALGFVLMFFFLAWIRLAFLIFALLFQGVTPSWEHFISTVFLSVDGIPLLAVGTAVGGVLAVIVFAMTVVSIPLLLDRDIGVVSAMATSVAAFLRNWRIMIGWGALIVLFTAAGFATFYLGLIITLPLIGYASWHAYRDLVAR